MKYVRHWVEQALNANALGLSLLLSAAYAGPTVTRPGNTAYLGDLSVTLTGGQMGGGGAGSCRNGAGMTFINADATRADVKILTSVFVQSVGPAGAAISIGARVSGTETAWNGYFADLRAAGGTTVAIVKGTAGVDADLATGAVTLSFGVLYHVRFEVTGAGPVNLSLKVWPDGT